MIKSLYAGVTGLRNHQTKMDVIGNNISNVNTAGYKSQRVVFKDLYYQTLSSATAPGTEKGGLNPMQLGYGSAIASIDVLHTRSGIQMTDVVTDLYISGDGYFQVQSGSGEVNFTRVGRFSFDEEGNLVDANGYLVCGGTAPLTSPVTTVSPIQIADLNKYSELSIGLDGTISAINSDTGLIEDLAQIALVKFINPNGLSLQGNQYLKQTQNSGDPTYAIPGTNATGAIISNGLEMSNVDLSKELTDMIITQRGFQANSRVITTSDEILNELVNLKR
jgi:flagellar hook protein FlgE